jgi:hypothetical protein
VSLKVAIESLIASALGEGDTTFVSIYIYIYLNERFHRCSVSSPVGGRAVASSYIKYIVSRSAVHAPRCMFLWKSKR